MRKAHFWGFLEISSCLGGLYRPIKWHSKNQYFTEIIWNFKFGEPKFDFLTRNIIRIAAVWFPSVLLTIWNWFRYILKHIMKIPKQKIPDFSKKTEFQIFCLTTLIVYIFLQETQNLWKTPEMSFSHRVDIFQKNLIEKY